MAKRKNKIIEIEIIDTMFPNKAIWKYEDKTIIVKGGLKGQTIGTETSQKR